MDKDPKILEQKAYDFLSQEKFYDAFVLYQKAANIYKSRNNHKQAALCFASAASCWSKKSGEKTFYNAALSYEAAAREADKSGDLEYASMLYKYAAINYERDREFINFSDCFYHSKECYRKFLTYCLINPKKIHTITRSKEERGIKGVIKRIFLCFALTLSYLVWGHGERPVRTLYSGIFIIFVSALLYMQGLLFFKGGVITRPHFWQAFYFSVITFTTVGFGDITPVGVAKVAVTIEALCGIFIIPLFVIGLARKYLRV